MEKKIAVAALSLLLAFGPVASGFATGSVAHGDISVFKGGQLADKLSGQNPVEEGSLMVCDGKCMIKSEGVSLVAANQAKFAIRNEESVFNLYVRSGEVNYVINDNTRRIAFHTPGGTYSVAEVIFNASSSPAVRGSVVVTETGETEITVTEGRLVFATADGMKAVDANNKIVLAIAEVAGAAGAASAGATGAGIGTGVLVTGAIVSAVAVGVVASNDGSGDSAPAAPAVSAPATPTPGAPTPSVAPAPRVPAPSIVTPPPVITPPDEDDPASPSF
jgi:hypothetical protein